jgi:hypothetical protein
MIAILEGHNGCQRAPRLLSISAKNSFLRSPDIAH